MRGNADIFKIIVDYFSGEISDTDRQTLDEWLKDPKNRAEFKAYAKVNFLTAAEPYFQQKEKTAPIISLKRNLLKIAAVLMLLVSVGVLWKYAAPQSNEPSKEFVSIAIDGQYKPLDPKTTANFIEDKNKNRIAKMEGGALKFLKNTAAHQLIINVPNGKTLKVLLSDGTEILVNAGTQISFNTDFVKDQSRRVHLSGEAFFGVAKDARHPFFVTTEKFTTKVLGTQFNISSYRTENSAYVSLLEGKVEVISKDQPLKKVLAPGQKIEFTAEKKIPTVENTVPEKDLDWLNNSIAFENNTTEEVLSKLERVYGLEIIRNRMQTENVHFSGTFKIENLDQITHSLELLLDCKIRRDGSKLIILPTK